MLKFLLALMGFFSFIGAFSQSNNAAGQAKSFLVQGIIVDSISQAPLHYISISLLEPGNAQPIKTAFTQENGSFTFSELPAKDYQLALSCVGYKTKTIRISPQSIPALNLGQLALVPAALHLQQVQIIAQRQLIEQEPDKLIYNVEADPESNTLSALEMLRKVPMLAIDGNNNIQLNGSSSYQVLINGKPSSLFVEAPGEIFQSMPASTIKRIEIITNPPARYDADGVGGIINVITHRKTLNGYNAAFNAGLNSFRGASAGGFLAAKAGKFGFSGNVSQRTTTNPTAVSSFTREDRLRQNLLEQEGQSNSSNGSRLLSGEITYDLGQRSMLTLNYKLNYSQGTNNFSQQAELRTLSGETTQAYQNLNNGRNHSTAKDLGLDYQLQFKKHQDQLLTFSYKLNNSNRENTSDFTLKPVLNYEEQVNQTGNNGSTREHIFQADYVQPIKKQLLEFGLKSSMRENNNNYFYQRKDLKTGLFELNPRLSNNFDYWQDIHAAYASLNLKLKKIGLRAGARLEETTIKASFRTSDTFTSQQYPNLIPNISLSYLPKGNATVRIAYNQRLERPPLYALNPYINQTDPRNISYGNPELVPAVNHAINLNYTTFLKGTSLNAGIFHNFTNNAIQQFTTLGADTVARTTFGNIGKNRTYGLMLSGNTTFLKKISLNLNTSANYNQLTSTLQGRLQHNRGFSLNASGNMSYRLNKDWRINGNVGYTSPRLQLQGQSSAFIWSGLTLNKEVLKNKGNLTLSVTNPFQQYRRYQDEVRTEDFHQILESTSVIRQYNLAFSYRFGKMQTSAPRKKRISQQEG